MMLSTKDLISSRVHLVRRFKSLCYAYSQWAAQAGVHAVTDCDSWPTHFSELCEERQKAILQNLQKSVDICSSASRHQACLATTQLPFVWWALRDLGFAPPSDLFSFLTDTHLIEVYSSTNVQLFRTFNMFACVSYSIEDLFSYEWHELFEREENGNDVVWEVSQKILKGEIRNPVFLHAGPVVIRERFSSRRRSATIQTKFLAPLHLRGGGIGGYLSCIEILSSE